MVLNKDLTDKQIDLMELVLSETDSRFDKIQNILIESAELSGREHGNIKLFKHQVTPALMIQISKRVFNGFSPGIGKTFSSCGAYALYRSKCIKSGKPVGKVLCVTEGNHLHGFKNDWNSGGVKLLPISEGTVSINKELKKAEEEGFDYDGIVTTWSSLITNGFLLYYLEHSEEYTFAVFDETTPLMNNKNITPKVVDMILNKYKGGIEYCMFLNGTSFNKNIYDIYYQMNILVPKLIPNKKWIDDRYVIKEEKRIWTNQNGGKVLNKFKDIVNYKNQEDFFNQLKYYYIVRNKSDVKGSIPSHVYKLHGIELSPTVKRILKKGGGSKDINSPNTSFGIELTPKKFSKLEYLINRFKETIQDRPIIYAHHKDAQKVIGEEIKKLGYSVAYLNGDATDEEKSEIITKFNNKEIDTLVFNIIRAVNLPTSDRIIFYEIPISPNITNQVKARIDRNNYDTVKFYDFLCYLDSPEMVNIVQLSHFREHHGTLLTGQGEEKVYSQLITQLEEIYDKERIELVGKRVEQMYKDNHTWNSTEEDIYKLLNL